MIKKILIAVLAAVLLLSGCSANKEPYSTALADELLGSGAFEGSEMAPLSLDVATMLFNINPTSIKDGVYYLAVNTSVSADELLILVLANEQAAIEVEKNCQEHLDAQIATCKDYCPQAVPRLEKALLSRRGNTILMVVGNPDVIRANKDIQ